MTNSMPESKNSRPGARYCASAFKLRRGNFCCVGQRHPRIDPPDLRCRPQPLPTKNTFGCPSVSLTARSLRCRGFTLMELMVTLAIMTVLVTVGAPSFKRLIQSSTISSNVNSFLADVRYARSEAISRGGNVIMCRSDDPEAPSPICNSGSAAQGWATGWIVFHDLNNDGQTNLGEPVLRRQSPITSLDSILEVKPIPSNKFRFTAAGRLLNLNSATTLKFGGAVLYSSDIQRTVCVSLGGRARITGDGATNCGSNNE